MDEALCIIELAKEDDCVALAIFADLGGAFFYEGIW